MVYIIYLLRFVKLIHIDLLPISSYFLDQFNLFDPIIVLRWSELNVFRVGMVILNDKSIMVRIWIYLCEFV